MLSSHELPLVLNMSPKSIGVVLIFLIVQSSTVYGDDSIVKSSLAFVIDDTGSMWNEIEQVKDDANAIFETVWSSNVSQIENFILVTFNDPTAQLRTVTKDRDEFKRALALIDVDGGDDCPEYAMKGIEIALEHCLPLSYLYVFTDASAKDSDRFDQIKSLAQKKQSQIVFVLTGICSTRSDPQYQVYHKVAEATGGQVFHTEKHDANLIIKYVKETIKERGDMLISTKLSPGYGKKLTYPVDTKTGDVLISVTGEEPKIGDVTGPGGSKPDTHHIIKTDEVAVVRVTGAKPGDHEVEVGSKSETHAVITAKTSIHFQLGFSTFKPSSISETATRPAPDGITFLSIKLNGEGVKLNTAKILDMSDNVIKEIPLELIDEKGKFYVALPFDPPTTMFQVSVSGYDVESKTPIIRKSPTPIERQNLSAEIIYDVPPTATIDEEPKIITEYNDRLRLKCKVHGYPRPDIVWEEKDTGIILPGTVSVRELPYDYISFLNIEKADKNTTYQCKASNTHGVNIKYIEVETKRTVYFNIIEAPKDMKIQYNKAGRIECKVDAYPPVTITWYKDRKVVTNDANLNVELSSDNSTLTIKHMQPKLQGKFICEARNEYQRKLLSSNVFIFGLVSPKIKIEHEEVRIQKGADVDLFCRIIQGTPKPTIRWSFIREDKETFEVMKETSEIIRLRNVTTDHAGSYKCVAWNIAGSDRFNIELHVEYPPKIKDDVEKISAKDGEEVIIRCDVDGVPPPKVKWIKNGAKILNTANTRISRDHSLKIRTTLPDTGNFICEAENKFGTARKEVYVQVYVPVNIDIPKVSTIETMVGKDIGLPCRVDGYPRPEIKWIFHSIDPKISPKNINPELGMMYLNLKKVQLDQQGYYTCIASNGIGGSANITYELKIYAPPTIENIYSEKTFEAVEGDLALRIQCKATGSPKPTITWKKNDRNLAMGSEWFDMEEDGTLIMKHIDMLTQGTYVCIAQNKLGTDTEIYNVVVNTYPTLQRPKHTILLKVGESANLTCDIPHRDTDLLRWYKDGVEVTKGKQKGKLILSGVTLSDDGFYTCRVSDFSRARSVQTKVVIGSGPTFITEEKEQIDFSLGNVVLLVCDAKGEPTPQVTWKHNGKEIKSVEMLYPIEMNLGNRGIYDCEVTNDFGSIHRSFNISSRDCIFNTKVDFPDKQPLMVLGGVLSEIIDDNMVILNADYFYLNCPMGFSYFPSTTNVMAFCEGETKVKISGKTYNFAAIKCLDEVEPQIRRTAISCKPGNTEYIQVGFEVYDSFHSVYDVCLDKDQNVTLFTKHKLSPDHTGSSRKTKWFTNDLLPFDFDSMYDCVNQGTDFYATLGRSFMTSCCFAKRQLVNSRDLKPGIPPTASFSYLNVVPHWSTCNSKNWDDVENRVRKLAKSAGRVLSITTGIQSTIRMPGSYVDIHLKDSRGGNQAVPKYLWKVIQDPPSSASLAIIQVNVPKLPPTEADDHVLCPDICGSIEWMNSSNWHNVEDGYTYCCTITEFENVFGNIGDFEPGMNKVLYDAPLISEFSLTLN